ncbi:MULTISPECIES: YhdP family protein [Rheinheimera]|uniref:YhdP family protein n=1 Tax=Rheinheimera marina TaxID=1774958 RepID=A0ABV9JGG8_9GAMM
MRSIRQAFWYCLHKVWIVFAIGVVLMAALVSALRLGLPYAPGYKTDIEQWIKTEYGTEVRIGALSAGWQGTGPALVLQQLQVLDSQQQPQLSVDEIGVRLDFWRSLSNMKLTAAHFELSGLTYHVEARRWLGSGVSKPADNQQLFQALQDLFFKQLRQFSVIHSKLVFSTEQDDDIELNIKALNWQNDSDRHQGWGEVSVAGVTANTLSFIVDLNGEAHEANGQLYLASQQLDLLPWFQQLMPQTRKLNSAKLNFAAWGDIKMGKLQQIDVALSDNNVGWLKDGVWNKVALSDGYLQWKPTKQGWTLTSSPMQLSTTSEQWPDLQFQLSRNQDNYHASLQNLQLAVAQPLLQLFADDSEQLKQLLEYQLDARVKRLDLQTEGDQWYLSSVFDGLTSAPVGDIPGVHALEGQLLASAYFGALDLTGKDATLSWGNAFSHGWPYQGLELSAAWRKRAGNWQVLLPSLSLWRDSFGVEAEMVLNLDDKPDMDLVAELKNVPVTEAEHFFPLHHMPQSVIKYLKPALLSGDVSLGKVLWSGEFGQYPYAEHNGTFQALASVVGAEFQFDADWPSLTELSAELLFENASMTIQSQAGFLVDAPVQQGVTVRIPDLFHASDLLIDIKQQLLAEQVTTLMQASPMHDSVGETLAYLGVTGPVQGNVSLSIGLDHPGVQVKGDIDFQNNGLNLSGPALTGENLTGRLSFDNARVQADALDMTLSTIPVQFSLRGEQQEQGYQVSLLSQGLQNSQELLLALAPEFESYAQGPLSWQFKLDLQLAGEGYQYQSDLELDFADTELKLPNPLAKAVGQPGSVFVSTQGNQDSSVIALNYQDLLFFDANYQHQQNQVSQAQLSLGERMEPGSAPPGFTINANLEQTDFVPWLGLIQHQITASAAKEDSPMPPLSKVSAKVARLNLADELQLDNLQLEMVPADQHWQLKLQSDQAKGVAMLAKDLQQGGIAAELDFLKLFPYDTAAAEAKALAEAEELQKLTKEQQIAKALAEVVPPKPMPWLADLPPLSLNCKSCVFGPYDLGQLKLKTHSDGQSLSIDQFESRYKKHQLNLTGRWVKDEAAGRTTVDAEIKSPNFGELMQDYDLTSAVAGSDGEVQFKQMSWDGGPTQFNYATLAGDLHWRLGEGSLSEVSDKGARLLSVFSLGSLVRKLKLDFRDIFSKGFFFTEMTGDLKLDKGVAHTNNSKVEGAAGNIEIQGYADLVTRQLDYQMAFLPKVTSSLPVLVALLQFNPATGLAALALDELVESAEVVSKVNFAVTGNFAALQVTEVARHTTEIEIPRSELLKAEQEKRRQLQEQQQQNQPPKPKADSTKKDKANG